MIGLVLKHDNNWDNLHKEFKIMIVEIHLEGQCVNDEYYINNILSKKFTKTSTIQQVLE